MAKHARAQMVAMLLAAALLAGAGGTPSAAVRIEGRAQAGGGPLASATVTLGAASASEPRQLAEVTSGSDGRFELASQETIGPGVVLYVIAGGGNGNPALAMLSVLGNEPPAKIVINEMTTVAAVWTGAQFFDGG